MKRKRTAGALGSNDVPKRAKIDQGTLQKTITLLRHYYPYVTTLREYVTARSAKTRRRYVTRFPAQLGESSNDDQLSLATLLDEVVVGHFQDPSSSEDSELESDLSLFSQQLSQVDLSTTLTQASPTQADIIDFALWSLFRRLGDNAHLQHLLCGGYQRCPGNPTNPNIIPLSNVPGLYCRESNRHVDTLRREPWTRLPRLLGRSADSILTSLFIECGIFVPIRETKSYDQLSGIPLSELRRLSCAKPALAETAAPVVPKRSTRSWSSIRLSRNRIFYASPSVGRSGSLLIGLGPCHILNRIRHLSDGTATNHLAYYVFPRQCNLHNVFTSTTKVFESTSSYKDYTFREDELNRIRGSGINAYVGVAKGAFVGASSSLPKRLRGPTTRLLDQLRKRHARCPYHALYQHYCPRSNYDASTTSATLATDPARVSAFCGAVVQRVFPIDFWGQRDTRLHNIHVVLRNVDRFIRLRRFESLCLHDVMQQLRLRDVAWLSLAKMDVSIALSRSDLRKRSELMAELIFYLFDSMLIPLIRTCFHVTETNTQRNRIFYYRQDVWKSMTQPALVSLKTETLERCDMSMTKRLLAKRSLGVSRVRFLPKEQGMRPIINLRRRMQTTRNGQKMLGRSINSLLTPAFSILNFEKGRYPEMLGSALFSVEDIPNRLQEFKRGLICAGKDAQPLYFAKVDVRACFDTIPQERLIKLVSSILCSSAYNVIRYSRAKLTGCGSGSASGFATMPTWKYLAKATDESEIFQLTEEVRKDNTAHRSHRIFVEGTARRKEQRKAVLGLIREHVEHNLLKVDKQYYRQKRGIPQGSILSSLLCSYFYAELERECFSYIGDQDSILLRLIDDFLVISTKQDIAVRFVQDMHRGIPQFGVQIKAEKSLTNFACHSSSGQELQINASDRGKFPYCGLAIDTRTLELSRDLMRRRQQCMADTLTVEYGKTPGQAFFHKTTKLLKMQLRSVLVSNPHNGRKTILANLYHALCEIAEKSYYYLRSMSPKRRPRDRFTIQFFNNLVSLAKMLLCKKQVGETNAASAESVVTSEQVRWLASTAFVMTFQHRQTRYPGLLEYLKAGLRKPVMRAQQKQLLFVTVDQTLS